MPPAIWEELSPDTGSVPAEIDEAVALARPLDCHARAVLDVLPDALVLAIVGDLLGWVPRSARAVGVVAGPLAVLGYLAGSVPFGYLLQRQRLRRQLEGRASSPRPATGDPLDAPGVVGAAALTGLGTLLATTVAWDVALAATPGAQFSSAVGVYSNQAVGAWVSVALWTGAAAVVGHLAPVWSRFRGGSGLPPAVALGFAYAPVVAAIAALTFLAGMALTSKPRVGLLAALPVATVFSYLAWLADVDPVWSVTHGPELTLWTTVVSSALFARAWSSPQSQ